MRYWLERFTNNITMEKFALYSLATVVAMAVLLSALNFLSFNPFALLASTAVLLFVGYATNLLLGKLYGVGVSHESPVITALILALIINPTLDGTGLLVIALTAVVAMVSKFILAIRGRHIFNPAAIAVLLIGLTGLQYATWWVATPPLLPIVAIGAFLVLYKTRHLLMGGIFFVTAATIIFLSGLVDGFEPGYLAAIIFTSWPLLFFAGFMLSEPLTLPPRRYQKLLLAAIAGIGVALPFHVGGFVSSPELILVIVNVMAFLFAQRRGVRLIFDSARSVTPTVREFTFTPQAPLRFAPGQYLELNVPQQKVDTRGTRRSFSIIGIPEGSAVSLALKYPQKPSTFKQALSELKPGRVLSATRVSGDFVLPKDSGRRLLFIAGGVGITPFVSHIRSLQQNRERRDITLIYAAASSDELAYIAEFEAYGAKVVAVTPEGAKRKGKGESVASQFITEAILVKQVPDIAEYYAYVSGPPLMVEAVRGSLQKLGVRRVKQDYFSGY